MPLIHEEFTATGNIYSADALVADLDLQRNLRCGLLAQFVGLNSAASTLTLKVHFKNHSESVDYGVETLPTVAKASGLIEARIQPDRLFFLDDTTKAKIYVRSTNSSDTSVTVTVYVFDPNYPTVDAEFRDSELVPSQSAATYASGDVIGAQIAFNVGADRGSIVACRVLDKSKNSVPLELWLFRASIAPNPTNDWDNDPFGPSDTQLADLAGVIRIDDWFANNENTIGQATNLPLSFTDLTSGNLYAWLISRGAPVYTATSHLTVQLEVLKD